MCGVCEICDGWRCKTSHTVVIMPTILGSRHPWQQHMLARFKGEKELSPEVCVTKGEIHQGQSEVGKIISLLSEKWMT